MEPTQSEQEIRDNLFMEYCAKIAKESECPISITNISKNFVEENNFQNLSTSYFPTRFKRWIVNKILKSEKYSFEEKAKIYFVTSTSIEKDFLKKLLDNGCHITLDDRNRITTFKSKNGRLSFEGKHLNIGKGRGNNQNNGNVSIDEVQEQEEEDDAFDGDGSNKRFPKRQLAEDHASRERAEFPAKRVKQENVENVETSRPAAPASSRAPQAQGPRRPQAQFDATVKREPQPARAEQVADLPLAMKKPTAVPYSSSTSTRLHTQQNHETNRNFYAEFLKSMYYFLVDAEEIRIPGVKDMYRNAINKHKGQNLKASTIRIYFERCLDKLSLDVGIADDKPVYLNSFLKELLQVVQEPVLGRLVAGRLRNFYRPGPARPGPLGPLLKLTILKS